MAALSLVRTFHSRPWLSRATLLAGAVGTGLGALTELRLSQSVLIAWNVAALFYLGVLARLMLSADTADMRQRAETQDVGKWSILGLTGAAIAVCIVAIASELIAARDETGLIKGLDIALVGATIVTTWVFVHATFALHYAHAYYIELERESEPPLKFPDEKCEPDYLDFAYFAFIIGTAAQTADVSVASKAMRRLNLGHAVFAFFYNTTLLALCINIAASLLG
ncbi:DUF1345 domain-containing protein [Asticcacaulis sp. AND118]|uniref:DUF1345 domain-containing protein n=1 Tax=Asticcacaulis sp. AND118 TaxID=2840468 RepID=UPI001CFFA1E3|nr:DUF1345 domain-containing protein [Asticcacaulis sp. AND118]UDF05488.1 DUF1345 domain-containing protein [Asticcacaulis sp. AND118]